MKKLMYSLYLVAAWLLLPASAHAHIRLDPAQAVVGRQTYDVRVPNEKAIPTVKVTVAVPDNVEVTGVLPVAGWRHSEKKTPVAAAEGEAGGQDDEAASERITEVTWEGGAINPGEYMLFSLATNYQGKAGDVIWKAYQTYSDGSVVSWDDSSEDTPAPRVKVLSESATDGLQKRIDALEKDSGFQPDMNTWLAGAALVIALAALLLTLRRNSEDEPLG